MTTAFVLPPGFRPKVDPRCPRCKKDSGSVIPLDGGKLKCFDCGTEWEPEETTP